MPACLADNCEMPVAKTGGNLVLSSTGGFGLSIGTSAMLMNSGLGSHPFAAISSGATSSSSNSTALVNAINGNSTTSAITPALASSSDLVSLALINASSPMYMQTGLMTSNATKYFSSASLPGSYATGSNVNIEI